MQRTGLALVALCLTLGVTTISYARSEQPVILAQATNQAPDIFTDNQSLAIRGTDPVAYFTEGEPVAGSAEFEHEWKGATWRFASAENRDLFVENPEQYAPQYGGYCAYAVANGYTASIDPEAWRIVDDKLYLNFSPRVQRLWQRDIPGHITQANANWPEALGDFRR